MAEKSVWKRIKQANRPAQYDKRLGRCLAGVGYDKLAKNWRWGVHSTAVARDNVPYVEALYGTAKTVAAAKRTAGARLKTCARQARA